MGVSGREKGVERGRDRQRERERKGEGGERESGRGCCTVEKTRQQP